jgi:hypothetical protein
VTDVDFVKSIVGELADKAFETFIEVELERSRKNAIAPGIPAL